MKILITPGRVRSVIAGAATENDVIAALRRHGIRYGYSTAGGCLHIRIPCRSGCICIYRDFYKVPAAAPAVPFSVPILHPDRY